MQFIVLYIILYYNLLYNIINIYLNYPPTPFTILKGVTTGTPTSKDAHHCASRSNSFVSMPFHKL